MKFFFVGLDIRYHFHVQYILPKAIDILRESSLIFIEEYKVGKKKLDLLKIDYSEKEIIIYNEHFENKNTKNLEKLFTEKILKHKTISMISDGGYPLFADPGYQIQQILINYQIPFTIIAGTNSALHALLLSGMPIQNYYYVGFLPVKEKERKNAIEKLTRYKTTLAIMETPYRLNSLLASLKKYFSKNKVAIVFNITSDNEEIFRGKLIEAIKKYQNTKTKKPFVLVIDNNFSMD